MRAWFGMENINAVQQVHTLSGQQVYMVLAPIGSTEVDMHQHLHLNVENAFRVWLKVLLPE